MTLLNKKNVVCQGKKFGKISEGLFKRRDLDVFPHYAVFSNRGSYQLWYDARKIKIIIFDRLRTNLSEELGRGTEEVQGARYKVQGKATPPCTLNLSVIYAAVTKDDAQRSRRTFYEAVKGRSAPDRFTQLNS